MNYTAIANVLGKLLIVTGSSMVFPVICSLYYGEDDLYAIAITGADGNTVPVAGAQQRTRSSAHRIT